MSQNVREEVVRLIVDGKQVTGSYNELKKSQRQIIKNLRGMEQGTEEYAKESMKLNRVSKELDNVDGKIKGVSKTWTKQKSVWNQAKATFMGAFAAFTVAGAVQQIQQLGVQIVSFVKNLTKQRREITKLTDLTGRNLDVTSAKIQSIMDTYEKGFDETLVAANSLAKQMGIEIPNALDLIKIGFANGADANGEFLDNLKEYPAQFKAAGLSAEQAINIITQQTKSGIYSDKGIDTIKEGTLRLREMTKATREALTGIGISSEELEKKLRSGTITYFEAIQMVSRELDKLPPQSIEVGTALADIFGGAGEDAGLEYITMLGDMQETLTATETPTSRLADANERLALSFQQFSDDDGVLTKMEIGLKDSATAAMSLLEVFNKNGFWAGMNMLVNPAGIAKYAGRNVAQQSMDENPPTVGNVAPPMIEIPEDAASKTPGSRSFRQATTAKDSPITDDAAYFDDLIANIDEQAIAMATGWETLTLQMKHETGELYAGLTEATDTYEDQFLESIDAQMEADMARTQLEIANAELRRQAQEALIEAYFNQGLAAVDSAQSAEEAGRATLNVIRSNIKAHLSEALAGAIKSALVDVPFPFNLIAAAGAGGAASLLFNKVVPSFFFGGPTGSKGMGFGDQNGDFAGFTHVDEYVVPKVQRTDPYYANTERYLEGRKKFGMTGDVSTTMQSSPSTEKSSNNGNELSEASKMIRDAAVLLSKGVPAYFSRNELEDGIEDRNQKETAQNRGQL